MVWGRKNQEMPCSGSRSIMSAIPWPAVAAVTLPNACGFISGRMSFNDEWYKSLKTPDWKPPAKAFPIVWTHLYAGMGYASYLVWKEGGGYSGAAQLPLAMYGTQLALNLAWSPVFFRQRSVKGGLVTILLLDVAAAGTAYLFYKVTPVAGYIMIPYLVWLGLATALNYRIWKDNPDSPTITEVKDK